MFEIVCTAGCSRAVYGAPAQNIIDTMSSCGADLIVLGVRKGDVFGVATHVERTIAHEVVVNRTLPSSDRARR